MCGFAQQTTVTRVQAFEPIRATGSSDATTAVSIGTECGFSWEDMCRHSMCVRSQRERGPQRGVITCFGFDFTVAAGKA